MGYYHLSTSPTVRVGKTVVPGRSVLGWIRPQYEPGHLEPYDDRTRPVASELYLAAGSAGNPLEGRPVGPGQQLAVSAADPQAAAVPGPWDGLPQAPSLVEWRLFRGQTGTAWKIAVDFRHTQPPPRHFWEIYGAGTYPNCPTFAGHILYGTAGRYLFRLRIHPERLQPGPYRLAVRVTDTHGNRSTSRWPLVIVD